MERKFFLKKNCGEADNPKFDQRLPVNGYEEIKGHDPTVPVLIVTAYDTFLEDPRLAHADGYVIKSFNTDELKKKIHEKLTAS
jgi:two-component SAPR family response regulator